MLVLNDLVTAYDAFELGPIDLAVESEIVSVLGPSGSGKTTLLSAVAGIIDIDAGTITLDGMDLTEDPPEKRGTVLVFQDGALFPHMSTWENINYAASSPERVEKLAETLEITDLLEQQAATLSGGERQRVALARSLAADPDALLLDEPLANLDAPIRRRLRHELRDLLASLDIPVVYVTHDQHEATVIGDRMAVIADGTIHQLDTPTEVFTRPATPFVASFTGSVNLFRARVTRTNRTVLEWNDRWIEAPAYDYAVDETVWFCIRPEYVTVAADHDAHANVLAGRIEQRIFQGNDYLITVTPDGMDETIQLTLTPPTYNQLQLPSRERIRISLNKEAIHVISGPGMNKTTQNTRESPQISTNGRHIL